MFLPLSYFFTTWGARMDEWAVALMISTIYPASLTYISVYSFSLTVASICCGPRVGAWAVAKTRSRLATVQTSIVTQKLAIATSALLLYLIFFRYENPTTPAALALFATVILSGAIQRLANRASVICVEKGWAVVLSQGNHEFQTTLNSHIRRVDLVCKLAAPLVVSLVAIPLTVPWTMMMVTGIALLSAPIELFLIRKIYYSSELLQSHNAIALEAATSVPKTGEATMPSALIVDKPIDDRSADQQLPQKKTFVESWKFYLLGEL
ncbi:hypothetical protein HK100_011107 [Physocladia obscura]|uniref:Solute carrier family 40 member n=1 Tax=Physocladia obscura TaxID=109957 RepID=A0AAD5T9I6_9FUNG|nr:hypothetical protein HK100_011107 [Physocladia obscura]